MRRMGVKNMSIASINMKTAATQARDDRAGLVCQPISLMLHFKRKSNFRLFFFYFFYYHISLMDSMSEQNNEAQK